MIIQCHGNYDDGIQSSDHTGSERAGLHEQFRGWAQLRTEIGTRYYEVRKP
jgi:hypothetical protein